MGGYVIPKEEFIIFVIIAIIIALVLWVIAVYNGLVKSRIRAKKSWSRTDMRLKRRSDLVPNLIETVKGYVAYEEEAFARITELHSRVAQVGTPAEAMHASNALTRQLPSLTTVAENHPEPRVNNSLIEPQDESTSTENKISCSRRLSNTTTTGYNIKLEAFPNNIIADMLGLRPSQFLKAPKDEKETPEILFDF